MGNHRRTKTKAAEVEHAIRHHLELNLGDDPDLQASFAEALAKILQDFRDNWQKIYEELEKLRERIIKAQNEPTYGLDRRKHMPFFRMLRREIFGEADEATPAGMVREPWKFGTLHDEEKVSLLVDLSQRVYLAVDRELRLAGFWESIPARNKLKAGIQAILLRPDYKKAAAIASNRARIISRIMEIAEKNTDIILYAD